MTNLSCDLSFVKSLSWLILFPLNQSNWINWRVFPSSHKSICFLFGRDIMPYLTKIENTPRNGIPICQIKSIAFTSDVHSFDWERLETFQLGFVPLGIGLHPRRRHVRAFMQIAFHSFLKSVFPAHCQRIHCQPPIVSAYQSYCLPWLKSSRPRLVHFKLYRN